MCGALFLLASASFLLGVQMHQLSRESVGRFSFYSHGPPAGVLSTGVDCL